jgi:hypothetical protein
VMVAIMGKLNQFFITSELFCVSIPEDYHKSLQFQGL